MSYQVERIRKKEEEEKRRENLKKAAEKQREEEKRRENLRKAAEEQRQKELKKSNENSTRNVQQTYLNNLKKSETSINNKTNINNKDKKENINNNTVKAGPIQSPLFSSSNIKSSKNTLSAGRKAQFQDSFQKTQQERWDKEAAARKEEEKAEKRQNAMKYINSEGGITADNFMEIKPYKNTYSDAAVRSAENMKNQLEKQAAELQKEIEYSRIRHEAMTKNGSFENAKKEKAYKDKLEENLSKLNKEINYYNDVMGIKATDRVSNAVKGIANSTIATAGVLGETAKTALKDTAANVNNDELQNLRKEYRIKESELNNLKNYGFINPEDAEKDKEYLAKKAELEEMAAEIENMTQKTAVDMNSPYMKNYGAAQSYTQKATEGLEGTAKVLADTGISILDNAALYPTAAISPAIPLSIMGAKASAAKAYELSDRGISAGETLLRAIGSGAVEAATEKIPLENLADMVKVGGNNVVKNLLRQSGLEATEEGLSYVGNYIIDRAANDPEASFSVQELALSMLQGGLSGLFFGAGGSVIDTAVNGRRIVEGTVPTQKVYEGADGSTYLTPEKDLVMQYMNRPRRNTANTINNIENIADKAEKISVNTIPDTESSNKNKVIMLPDKTGKKRPVGYQNDLFKNNKDIEFKPTIDELKNKQPAKIVKVGSLTSERNLSNEEYNSLFKNVKNMIKKLPWYNMPLLNNDTEFSDKYGELRARVVEKTLKKGRSYKTKYGIEQIEIMEHLPELFENGKVINMKHDEKGEPGVNRIITLLSPVEFSDGKIGVVKLNVKESSETWEKNRIHENKILEISDYEILKKGTSSTGHDPEELRTAEVSFNKDISSTGHDPQELRTAEISYTMSIDEMLNFVNGDDRKYINDNVGLEDDYKLNEENVNTPAEVSLEKISRKINAEQETEAFQKGIRPLLQDDLKIDTERMDSIAQRIGSNVKYFLGENSDIEGFYENGDIYLNIRSLTGDFNIDAWKIFKHEFTHSLENTIGYERFISEIENSSLWDNFIKAQGFNSKEDYYNNIREDYKAAGLELSDTQLQREAAAKFVQDSDMFTNEETIRRLTEENQSLARDILNWIRSILKKVKNFAVEKINGKVPEESAEVLLSRAEDYYMKALFEAERKGAKAVEERQYSIETDSKGRQYVKESRNVPLGKDINNWHNEAGNFINDEILKKGKNGVLQVISADGDVLTIDNLTAYKLEGRDKIRDINGIRPQTNDEYERKLRMAGHIDELAQVSKLKNKTPVPDTKNHLFAKDGFNYRKAYYEDSNGDYYELTVSAGKNGNVETVYNINKITSKGKHGKNNNSVSSVNNANKKTPLHNGTRPPKMGAVQFGNNANSGVSNNNISQQASNSNTGNGNVTNSNSTVQHSIRRRKKETSKEQTESEKVRKFTRRASNIFLNDFKESMGISRFVENNDLRNKAEEFARKSIEKGGIDSEEADRLFNEMYERSRIINDEFYQEFKQLKNELRTTRLYGGDNTADIKKYFGTLRVTRDKNALPADSFYMELSSKYPYMFPESITNIEDQLDKMAEVSKSIAKTEDSLKNYGTGQSKEEVRMLFDQGLQNLEENLTDIMRYKEQQETKKLEKQELIKIAEELRENPKRAQEEYKKNAEIKKEYTKLKNKEIITDKEEEILLDLVKGRRSIDNLPNNVNKGAIKNLYPKFKEKFKSDEILNKYRAALSEEVRELARGATATSDLWKDKKAGFLYSRETMERNFEDITKKAFNGQRRNRESKDIIDTYFKPIHENEAKATRLKNELGNRIRDLKLDTNEKYNVGYIDENGKMAAVRVSESGLVQLLGEGKIKETELKAMRADVEKIKKAVNEFRDIYNKLFEMTNEALVAAGYAPVEYRKDYFPHFSETKPDTVLGKAGALVGINIARDELPTDIAGLTHTFRPGKKWVGNLLRREGDSTEYDALKGFDRYINGVADVIFHTEDIKKLRALEDELRYRYSSKGTQDRIDEILDYEGATWEQKYRMIEDIYNVTRVSHLPNLVTELRNYTDNLAGKKSIADRTAEHSLGRGIYNFMRSLENKVSANMVAINLGSWATNWIPITQVSGVVRLDSLFKGIRDTILAVGKDDGFKYTSDFLVNRRGSDPLYKTTGEKWQKRLTIPFSVIDNGTSEVVVRSLYYDKLRKGVDHFEAMDYANDMAARIMADRSKGAQPTIFNDKNPVTKLFTMFQTEVNNQYGYFFKDVPEEIGKKASLAFASALFKMFGLAYLYNQLYELFTGRRAAFDPLDMIITAVSDFADEDKKASEAVGNVIENVLDNTPFIGGVIGGGRIPLSSALPDVVTVGNTLIDYADGETSGKRTGQTIGKELVKPLTYIVPPVGGGQIKKTIEAGIALSRGEEYSYDKNGDKQLKYAIEDPSGFDIFRAVTFGKSSLPEYREWGERNFKSLSVNQTKNYYKSVEAGISYSQYMTALDKTDGLNSDKDSEGNTIGPDTKAENNGEGKSASLKKKEAIDSIKGLSEKQREVLYEAMDVSEKLWK